MTKIIQDNKEYKYKIYQSNLIINNKEEFIKDCYKSFERFKFRFPDQSSTWLYKYYNTFSMSSGSNLFYDLFKELSFIIKEYNNNDERLWFQSWINFHLPNEVLDWHTHEYCDFHGYINIEPKQSKTIFDKYEILNETGNIYIGQTSLNNNFLRHKVEILESYSEPRITIAFDVYKEHNFKKSFEDFGQDLNLAIFPLL
jgi:hypothetical protein